MEGLATHQFFKTYNILFLVCCIALSAFSGQVAWLAMPFVFLYCQLLTTHWKRAWWILLFLVPLSIDIKLNNKLATTVPDEPMMWMLLLVFTVGILHRPHSIPKWWWRNPITLIVLLQFVWLLITVCYSQIWFLSFKFLLAKLWFLTAFFVLPIFVFKEKKDFEKGFFLFFIPVVFTIVYITFRQAFLDFDFMETNNAIGMWYYNHVEYAGVVSALFPLLLVAARICSKEKRWTHSIMQCLLLFFIPVIFLTYARAAIIAIMLALLVGYAVKKKWAQWIMPSIYSLITLLLTILISTNSWWKLRPDFEKTYMHHQFGEHVLATFKGQDLSSMERLYRWIAAIRMSHEHPIVGFGPNTFYYYYKSYAVSAFETYTSDNPEHSTTHNYFLFMLTGQGWPAMLLYAILVAVVIAQAQKTYHRFKDRQYRLMTLGLVMMFTVHFITNFFSEMIETHKIGALFYLNISLLMILDLKSRKTEDLNSVDQTQLATLKKSPEF